MSVYDRTLAVLRHAVDRARLGNEERLADLKRLGDQSRMLERAEAGDQLAFASLIVRERAASPALRGMTASGPARPASARARKRSRAQLTLPGIGI